MTPEMFEFCRKECKNHRCKNCFCYDKSYCFAKDLETKVKNFPNRSYKELSPEEKKNIGKMTKVYIFDILREMAKGV